MIICKYDALCGIRITVHDESCATTTDLDRLASFSIVFNEKFWNIKFLSNLCLFRGRTNVL